MSPPTGSSPHSKTSLYVGNLPPNVTEAKLLEKFSEVGAVCSIRICRDKLSKRFLGYAYVNFRREEDATRALETMNAQLIGGRPIRVMWPERTKTQLEPKQDTQQPIPRNRSHENPVGILLTGLNAEIRDKDLHGIFSSSGSIVECGVSLDNAGNSKGFGYVQFQTEEAVENCLDKVKGWLLMDSKLSVTKLYANVHVFNFGYLLNFGSLRELFGQYGAIIVYRVVTKIGKCNGFGYVTFKKLKSAAYAVAELNGKDLGEGLKLRVESAPCPLSDRVKSGKVEVAHCPSSSIVKLPKHDERVNLYIKIMEPVINKERLQELFSPFGPIISVKVLRGKSKDGKCTGFVCFAVGKDATKAINEMHGKVVGNGPLDVTLAIAKNAKSTSEPESASKVVKLEAKSALDPEQKRALAERLYLVVKQLNASMAGSITAILLELTNLAQLMTQPAPLKAKVDETVVALLLNREQHLQQIESAPAGSAAA